MNKLALLFIVFVPWLGPVAVAQDPTKELESKVLAIAQSYVDAEIVNSVAIGIIDGDTRLTTSAGQLSKEDPSKADENTIFEIGSISKVFTGILLADAIKRGLVTADQPVDDLLPAGVRMPVLKRKPERKITLTQLSTHISGLPRLPDNTGDMNLTNPYANYSAEDLFEFLNSHELSRKPGIAEEYSNLGVGLLGEVLSQKQEMDYETLLRSRITGPLKMSDTSLKLSPVQTKRLAPPHDAGCEPSSNWTFQAMAGAGGIRSSVNDMLKFARANIETPEGEIGDAIDLAFTQQRKPKGIGSNNMGFGWMINPKSETRWHNGGTGGYHSMMFVNRKDRRAVVVLCNTATPEVDTLASEIMALVSGRDVKPREFKKAIEVTPELCARYVGKYKLNDSFMFDIAYANDDKTKLTVQLTGQSAIRIYPESETTWFLKVVEAKIEFTLDDDGKCTALTLHQNGIQQTAKKE
jgi:CubicO group peptidase (beta-lactamase class C family)